MQVFMIEGTSYVVISKLDGFFIDAEHGFFIDELEKNFKEYIYVMQKKEYREKVKKTGRKPGMEIAIGENVKEIYLHKPLFKESEEYYSVKIDRNNDAVSISYEGSAPKDLRNEILFGSEGVNLSRNRFF